MNEQKKRELVDGFIDFLKIISQTPPEMLRPMITKLVEENPEYFDDLMKAMAVHEMRLQLKKQQQGLGRKVA